VLNGASTIATNKPPGSPHSSSYSRRRAMAKEKTRERPGCDQPERLERWNRLIGIGLGSLTWAWWLQMHPGETGKLKAQRMAARAPSRFQEAVGWARCGQASWMTVPRDARAGSRCRVIEG